MLVCSTHPENPGIAPFCEDLSTYSLALKKLSTFLPKLRRSCTVHSEVKLLYRLGILFFRYKASFRLLPNIWYYSFLISSQNLRRSFGHFLYTLYDNPLGPGAEPALAFLTISYTSFHVGSLSSKATSDCFSESTLGQSPRGVSRYSAVWILFK